MRTMTGGIRNMRGSVMFARLGQDNTSDADIIGDIWRCWYRSNPRRLPSF